MKIITITFEASAESPWLEDILENNNVLTDLATRTVFEFVRDWKKMQSFASGVVASGKLLSTSVQEAQ